MNDDDYKKLLKTKVKIDVVVSAIYLAYSLGVFLLGFVVGSSGFYK